MAYSDPRFDPLFDYHDWRARQIPRESREWDRWDGSEAHGIAINDRQCARMDGEMRRLGVTIGLMHEFNLSRGFASKL